MTTASDQPVLIPFVDDERLIRRLHRSKHTSEGALRALEECSVHLAGLITDVNLGSEVTGWDIAKRARELRPDLPVVYTSGYAAGDWSAEGVPHSTMVAKPYAPAQIVTAISALINKAASQPGSA